MDTPGTWCSRINAGTCSCSHAWYATSRSFAIGAGGTIRRMAVAAANRTSGSASSNKGESAGTASRAAGPIAASVSSVARRMARSACCSKGCNAGSAPRRATAFARARPGWRRRAARPRAPVVASIAAGSGRSRRRSGTGPPWRPSVAAPCRVQGSHRWYRTHRRRAGSTRSLPCPRRSRPGHRAVRQSAAGSPGPGRESRSADPAPTRAARRPVRSTPVRSLRAGRASAATDAVAAAASSTAAATCRSSRAPRARPTHAITSTERWLSARRTTATAASAEDASLAS